MKQIIVDYLSPLRLLAISLSVVWAGPLLANDDVDRGRYLVSIAGCNDCHTDNWMETNGVVDEGNWLTGSAIGWRGPWGTTYASNLRLLVRDMSEDAWVSMLKTRANRPPMPWMNVNKLSDSDARAIYRFIATLGVRGDRMPTALDVAQVPSTPYFLLEPVLPAAAPK